jgi:tetratricopeptide (TPR) repeat protein
MSRIALLAVPLGILLAGPASAQQTRPTTTPVSTAAAPASQSQAVPAAMSPRETAEMHGDILMARKEYSAAIRTYLGILHEGKPDAVLLNKVGVAYQQLGDLNRAAHFYKESAKADKRYVSAVNNLGTVEYEKKHYGKSIALYKKAIPMGTDLSTVYSNLGYAYFANKEYPQAMDAFGKALAIDPHVFDRKGGAGTIVQQRSTTDPGLFYFFVAKSYAMAGDVEDAARYLKIARDDGYKDFMSAQTDPAFAKIIKDPRMQEVLQLPPSYADGKKPPTN